MWPRKHFAPEVPLEPVPHPVQLLTATSTPIKIYGTKTVLLVTGRLSFHVRFYITDVKQTPLGLQDQKYPQYCWEFHDQPERPSPEPLLKKRRPQPYWGGDNSGNALEASNALNYRAWGIPAVLSTEFRKSSESVSGVFPEFFRNFFGKSQPYWGCGLQDILQGDLQLALPSRRMTWRNHYCSMTSTST